MRKRLALKIIRARTDGYSRDQRLRAYRGARIAVGTRVKVISGCDTGRSGVVHSRTRNGTYSIKLDDESTLRRPDGSEWFPKFDRTALIVSKAAK